MQLIQTGFLFKVEVSSDHNKESMLFTVDAYYGNLREVSSQEPSGGGRSKWYNQVRRMVGQAEGQNM